MRSLLWGAGFLAVVALAVACETANDAECTLSKDCGDGFACEAGKCVDIDKGHGSTSAGSGGGATTGGAVTGVGGGVDPGPCLDGTNCVGDADCANGYHCNTALAPPQCEQLYCGALGTTCSESALCAQGLKCLDQVCVSGDTCSPANEPCELATDCCSGVCEGYCVCQTCAELLNMLSFDFTSACPEAQPYADAMYACACAGPCASSCGSDACQGLSPGGACFDCVNNSCSTQLNDCFAN